MRKWVVWFLLLVLLCPVVQVHAEPEQPASQAYEDGSVRYRLFLELEEPLAIEGITR